MDGRCLRGAAVAFMLAVLSAGSHAKVETLGIVLMHGKQLSLIHI